MSVGFAVLLGFALLLLLGFNSMGGVEGRYHVGNAAYNSWNPGAKCVHKSELAPEMYSLCIGYIPHDWIYYDEWQANRTAKVADKATEVVSRNDCILQNLRIYCAEAYRPCYNVTLDGFGDTAVAGNLCGYMCEQRNDTCYFGYLAFGLTPEAANDQLACYPNPWPTDFAYPDAPLFPVYNGTYDGLIRVINDTSGDYLYYNVTLPCYDQNWDIYAGFPGLACPEGTYEHGSDTCAFNCPEPLVDDDEFDAAIIMLSIVGWFSFILTAFLVVSYLLQPRIKLAYPASLTFYFIVCVMCLSFTWCFGSLVGYRKLWCHDDKTPNRWGDALCTMQGVTYVYFTLASAIWWLLIGIALLITLAFNYKPQERMITSFKINEWNIAILQSHTVEAVMHLFAWGTPLLIVIIALGNHKIGFGNSDFWCTIHSGEEVLLTVGYTNVVITGTSSAEQYDLWNLILLTIPILIITFVGSIVMGLVFVFAWIKSKQCGKFLLQQWRLLVLMMLYIWIYSFVFSHHIVLAAQRHDQYTEYINFISCQIKFYVYHNDCSLSSTVNYPLWFIASFNMAAQGIFVFFIYGTARAPYAIWAGYFRYYVLKQSSSASSGHPGASTVVKGRRYENTQDLNGSMVDEEDDVDIDVEENYADENNEVEMDRIDDDERSSSEDEEEEESD